VRERAGELEALAATPIAVGFSPAEPLAALADHLDWPWPFLSDTERLLYARLGLPRAKLREVWTPGTKDTYRAALAKGESVHAPVEDPLQLGGDAIVRAGTVVALWRPRSPDDRPDVDDLMASLRLEAPRGPSGPGAAG
jgi:hypothetical protein